MSTRMQQRRGTAEQWTIANPILAEGELGWESDTNSFKIGDGVNNWANLEYFQDGTALSGSLEDYVELASLGVADGVATLDSNGNVPINQLGNIIDGAPGVLDTLNELAAALNDDADFFTTINSSISSGDSATLASAESYADSLAVNYDPVGSADAAEAAANSYTDSAIAAIPPVDLTGYATETYVDTAESDAVSASNAYTDSLVGDATVDGTTGNTVTDRIATAVANLVDTAPATLDTLNELAAALGDDPNFATTVSNQIGTKADAVHTHLIADVTDVTATAAELNVLDGITATTTELNYTDGVTSNIQTQLNSKAPATQTIDNKSAGYTTVAGDAGKIIRSTGGAITITVANVLSIGQRIDFLQHGTGQVTFAQGSGVTLVSRDNARKTAQQYSSASIICTASGIYHIIGDLVA